MSKYSLTREDLMWQKEDRFSTQEGPGWTVLDFDYGTETVLGIHDDGSTRIFFFYQIERIVQ